jgi:hypothetical protein
VVALSLGKALSADGDCFLRKVFVWFLFVEEGIDEI